MTLGNLLSMFLDISYDTKIELLGMFQTHSQKQKMFIKSLIRLVTISLWNNSIVEQASKFTLSSGTVDTFEI